MKNQVFERVFKKMDAKRKADLEEAGDGDEVDLVDLRADFLRQ